MENNFNMTKRVEYSKTSVKLVMYLGDDAIRDMVNKNNLAHNLLIANFNIVSAMLYCTRPIDIEFFELIGGYECIVDCGLQHYIEVLVSDKEVTLKLKQ